VNGTSRRTRARSRTSTTTGRRSGCFARRSIMATTMEDLEKRVAALERELKELRELLVIPPDETPAEAGARMLREAKRGQAALVAAWDKAMEQMGIKGEPVGAQRLRQMMIEAGVNPETNEFSRGIIEMREE